MNKVVQKVLIIGGATKDIFIEYSSTDMIQLHTDEFDKSFIALEEGKKIAVSSLINTTGGGATNAAATFSSLNFETSIFCKIGTDSAGDEVLDDLHKRNINTSALVRTTKEQTATSFIIPSLSGNRAILVFRGANVTIEKNELPFSAIEHVQQLYITSLSGPAAQLLLPLLEHAKKHNVSVAINPGSSQLTHGADTLREALSMIDILILNSDEATVLMHSLMQKEHGLQEEILSDSSKKQPLYTPRLLQKPITYQHISFHLTQFFNAVLQRGPKIVVVTDGAQGVYAATQSTLYFHPSPTVHVVSTIGAGDAFGSAFVAALGNNKSVDDALRCGTLNALSVIAHVGAKTGILSAKEMEKQLAALDKNLLQAFTFEK